MSQELDYARELVASAIYAPDHYIDVITIACAATYKVDDFYTAPRILSLGKKGTGKSTLLKVAKYLANGTTGPTGVLAMTAPSYVADYRMNPHWTPLIDEINHLFGEAGQNGKNSKFYTYLNQGYSRDTGNAQYQENKVPLSIPIFGFVFMAGLGLACPEDMRDRSIVLRMEKAPKKVSVADFSSADTRNAFTYAGRMLKSWTQRAGRLDVSTVRGLHPDLNHRTMEVWGPLFAVAQAAGDEWVQRLLTAFERLELNADTPVYAPEDQILADYLAFAENLDGVPSGEFAEFAYDQDHGAFASMKPGQFKQFAVRVLGPTSPFYTESKTVRGWSGAQHQMTLESARDRMAELELARESDESETVTWEDF